MEKAKLTIYKLDGKYSGLVELGKDNSFYLCSEKRRMFKQEVPQYMHFGTLIFHLVSIPNEVYKKGIWVNFSGDGIRKKEKKSIISLVKRLEQLVELRTKFPRDL